MKKIVKVAVMAAREFSLDLVSIPADTNIQSTINGTIKLYGKAYFSDSLPVESRDEAIIKIDDIIGQKSNKYVKIAPDEPWIDTTSFHMKFDRELTTRSVERLNKVMGEYEFVCAKDDYEVKTLLLPNVKINFISFVKYEKRIVGGPAPADLYVEPVVVEFDNYVLYKTLTINKYPEKWRRKKIADILKKTNLKDYEFVRNIDDNNLNDKNINEVFARILTDEFEDIAFVAVNQKQRYKIYYEMKTPFFKRLFGSKKQVSRLMVKDLSKN